MGKTDGFVVKALFTGFVRLDYDLLDRAAAFARLPERRNGNSAWHV